MTLGYQRKYITTHKKDLIQQYRNKKEFDISRKFSLLQYHRGTMYFVQLIYNHL